MCKDSGIVAVVDCSVLISVMLHVALCPRMLTLLWLSTSFSSASLHQCLFYKRSVVFVFTVIIACLSVSCGYSVTLCFRVKLFYVFIINSSTALLQSKLVVVLMPHLQHLPLAFKTRFDFTIIQISVISYYRVFQKKLHKVCAPQFCNRTSQSHAVFSKMFRKKLFTR